jgi:RHS repeat-associated protein
MSSAPAYGYDPYGLPLQVTTPVTDFVYGGMFFNADSGLYLTNRRAYDPSAGRWLSRDPLDDPSAPIANLYAYVGGNPIANVDPLGLVDPSLGGGYTARIDQFNTGGRSSFEIHVFDPSGTEVGVFGPGGWIKKHGIAEPPNLPDNVYNSLKGHAVDQLRRHGFIPPKGMANIKGLNFGKILRGLGTVCRALPIIALIPEIMEHGPAGIPCGIMGGCEPAEAPTVSGD